MRAPGDAHVLAIGSDQPAPEASRPARRTGPGLSRSEWLWVAGILCVALALRVAYVFLCDFNSDEPQHLHVARAWAHGQVQYRDVFDNHTPAFHILMAPFVAALGERFDLLIWMRLIMVPLYALTLWCTYVIGRTVLSPRRGIWAAVLTATFLPFLKESTEFRADDLWALLFVAAIAVAMSVPLRSHRAFVSGLLLGAALSVSMKTGLLLVTLAEAAVATRIVWMGVELRRPARQTATGAGLAVIGFAVAPAAVIAWFTFHGALNDLYYGAIQHNLLAGLDEHATLKRILYAPISGAVLLFARKCIVKRNAFQKWTPAYTFLFLLSALYSANFLLLWPFETTDQNFLPLWPILIIVALPFIDSPRNRWAQPRRAQPERRWSTYAGPVAFSVIQLVAVLALGRWYWLHGSRHEDLAKWKAVLELTGPQDFVMDPKGDLIFRDRAFYWGFEAITRARMDRGLIPETISESLIATRTCVVDPDIRRFPMATRSFIESNYVSVGPVLVAGKRLAATSTDARGTFILDVVIPADYVVVTDGRIGRGQIDQRPLSGGVLLETGRHEYRAAPGETAPVLLWAKAEQLGYLPHNLKPTRD